MCGDGAQGQYVLTLRKAWPQLVKQEQCNQQHPPASPAVTQPLILPIMQTTSSFYHPSFSKLSAASAENPDVQSFNRDWKAKLREDGKGVTWKHKQGLHVHTLWD